MQVSHSTLKIISLLALLSLSPNALAQIPSPDALESKASLADPKFAQFVPQPSQSKTQINYESWDEALSYFVFRMGKSIREGSPRPESSIATHRVYGHDSRYRLEGNRIIFSFLEPGIVEAISEYKRDLEKTADLVEIASLQRNEQLSFWINLHNVAVIEQIAIAYPVTQPRSIKIDGSDLPFDETPFITVNNVKMSPKDIRTKIVFQNWNDPRLIYAFFRGEIGGPSIQGDAFTSRNIADLLNRSGREFVNSLRGTQKSGKTLAVSKIYEEARPYFFHGWPTDFRAHLATFANEDVTEILGKTDTVRASIYEEDISDLANGERDPNYGYVMTGDRVKGIGVPSAVLRLLGEHERKIQKIIRHGYLTGEVTVMAVDLPGEAKEPDQIK